MSAFQEMLTNYREVVLEIEANAFFLPSTLFKMYEDIC